jgi:hypothetical protein
MPPLALGGAFMRCLVDLPLLLFMGNLLHTLARRWEPPTGVDGLAVISACGRRVLATAHSNALR